MDFLLSGSPWPLRIWLLLTTQVLWFNVPWHLLLCSRNTKMHGIHWSSNTPKHSTIPLIIPLLTSTSLPCWTLFSNWYALNLFQISSNNPQFIFWFMISYQTELIHNAMRCSLRHSRAWVLYKDEVPISHEFVNQEVNLPPCKSFCKCKTLNKFSQITAGRNSYLKVKKQNNNKKNLDGRTLNNYLFCITVPSYDGYAQKSYNQANEISINYHIIKWWLEEMHKNLNIVIL